MGRWDGLSFRHRVIFGMTFAASCAALLLLCARLPRGAQPLPTPPKRVIGPLMLPVLPLQGVVVILDPGHGGLDPGTECGPLSEAALTYRTAAEVAAALQAQGAAIVYTVHSRTLDPNVVVLETPPQRPSDAFLTATNQPLRLRHSPEPLWQRAATAQKIWTQRVRRDPNAARNVFFLSLHYDQFQSTGVSGSVVCVDRRVQGVPRFAIVLAQQLADGNLVRGSGFRGIRGVSGRELGVLDPKYNPVPEKALLELATLSNPQDALESCDPLWRTEMARRITKAILFVHQQ